MSSRLSAAENANAGEVISVVTDRQAAPAVVVTAGSSALDRAVKTRTLALTGLQDVRGGQPPAAKAEAIVVSRRRGAADEVNRIDVPADPILTLS
jgi:hypothetical protein